MADDVQVTFGANIQGLVDGVNSIKEQIEGFARSLSGIQGSLGEFGEALTAAFAVDRIKEFAEGMGELGDQTATAAAILGISTEDVGALGLMARSSGLSLQDLQGAFARLSRNLIDQADPARRALQALGLNFRQLQGESTMDQFSTLADAFAGVKDGAEKTAIAVALFGRSGAEMIPLLNEGKAGIDSWRQAALDLGVALGENVVAQLDQTHELLVKTGAALQGASIQGFLEFRGVIDGVAQIVEDLAHAFTDAMRQGGMLSDILMAVSGSAKVLVSAFAVAITALEEMWSAATYTIDAVGLLFIHLGEAVGGIFSGLGAGASQFLSGFATAARESATAVGEVFTNLGAVIGAAIQGNWSGAQNAFSKLKDDAVSAGADIAGAFKSSTSGFDFSSAESQWSGFLSNMRARMQQYSGEERTDTQRLLDELTTIWGSGSDKIAESQKRAVSMAPADQQKSAEEALEAQLTALDQEAEHYKQIEQQKQAAIEETVKTKQISAQQGLQATLDALQDELQDAMDVYKQEEALVANKPQKLAEVLKKEQELQDENAKAAQEAQNKAAEQTTQEWQKAFTEINSAFTSQISGLLKGTTSWGQALKNVLLDLTTDMIKFFVNWSLQAAESQALQIAGIGRVTAAQAAGSAAQASAQTSGAAAGVAASLSAILTTLANDAKAVFGGIFAFLAPVMGPAAAGPAAAGAATALAGGLAVGAWELPGDMPVMAHKGEMVVPAGVTPFAQALFANAAGSRGGDTHFNQKMTTNINGGGSGLSSKDIVDAVKKNGREIMREWSRRHPNFRP